jgi:hypothetical protein
MMPKDGFDTVFATEIGTPDGWVETTRKNSSLYDSRLHIKLARIYDTQSPLTLRS